MTVRFVPGLFGNHIVGFPTRRLIFSLMLQAIIRIDTDEYVCHELTVGILFIILVTNKMFKSYGFHCVLNRVLRDNVIS